MENKYQEALDSIKESYDAFYIENKYGTNTHLKEFELLSNLKGEKVVNAINWIMFEYDCYYKDDYDDENGTAFGYLRGLIENE